MGLILVESKENCLLSFEVFLKSIFLVKVEHVPCIAKITRFSSEYRIGPTQTQPVYGPMVM